MATGWTIAGGTTANTYSYTYTIPWNYVQFTKTCEWVEKRKEPEEKALPSFGDEFIDDMIGGAAHA